MPFLSSSSSSVPPGKMQAMCATGARLWPTLASFEHPSQETSGSSNVPGRRNCAQTTQGCSACSRCERRRLGGMMAALLCTGVSRCARLTGASELDGWIVTVWHCQTCLRPPVRRTQPDFSSVLPSGANLACLERDAFGETEESSGGEESRRGRRHRLSESSVYHLGLAIILKLALVKRSVRTAYALRRLYIGYRSAVSTWRVADALGCRAPYSVAHINRLEHFCC